MQSRHSFSFELAAHDTHHHHDLNEEFETGRNGCERDNVEDEDDATDGDGDENVLLRDLGNHDGTGGTKENNG